MTGALLVWLVLYASMLAISGFVIYIVRSFTQRDWSNRAVLRASSIFAFVSSAAIWALLILSG